MGLRHATYLLTFLLPDPISFVPATSFPLFSWCSRAGSSSSYLHIRFLFIVPTSFTVPMLVVIYLAFLPHLVPHLVFLLVYQLYLEQLCILVRVFRFIINLCTLPSPTTTTISVRAAARIWRAC
ncbi:hypothetical protein R3P38DRAFT_2857655 [Favolaschia claudopus]|uniref:Uncharacterized protein n=1 Tax=Favolaschia claudopus TaxID=2862362 RepID=A0AAW0DGE9_9AGAR